MTKLDAEEWLQKGIRNDIIQGILTGLIFEALMFFLSSENRAWNWRTVVFTGGMMFVINGISHYMKYRKIIAEIEDQRESE